ncbi:MAG: DegT/DnrJ/EryC1/StrS family aminotransferase [Nitrospirae bacterium]|nr:DegT/DnrJ/EryC1/StrS family aminotransferase [Nitrospirota bacterium]
MKTSVKYLPFSLPLIEEDEIEAIIEALKSCWITTGPKVKQFEKEFSEYIGCKHAIAVNSCTAALHLALEAIGIKEGDEIITTPMTFAATAEVIRYFKARPVFIDIDPVTMNIDTEKIEAYLSPLLSRPLSLPKAIIPVHYAGYPCEMDTIMELAEKYNLKVIEDAAHVLPAFYKDRMIGTIGDITCFSFYATKNLTTGEGGMITTDNDEWAERMRIMSMHGISRDAWKRYTAEGNWYYEIIAPGFKYNLTDVAAALGIGQLRKTDRMWDRRKKIAGMYSEAFMNLTEIEIPFSSLTSLLATPAGTQHSWHLYVIKLNLECLTIDRGRFIEELKDRGIGTSVHFIPLHIHPYYRDTYGYKPEDFPVAYETFQRIISLPIYPKMTDGDVERVIEAVISVIKKFGK